ncbi:MAG: tetratricopeptide repeat protein, partial [Archangiaceae bacterium]|nr:tetratricopeptide repeat protein [Archangiaceae bacterium]
WHHLACACIGLGRHDEAVKLMKKAIEKNPMPENAEVFAKTMERAKKKQRFEAPPQVPTEPVRHDAYLLAETGDLAAVRELLSSNDWNARRAALRAARYRYGSDDHTPVTKTARDAAAMVLEQSVAQAAPLATVCRSFALDLRGEGLDASVERPPDLGDRLTRHAFYEEFRSRGGVIVGQAPDTRVPFDDAVVFQGQPFGSTGQYVALVKDVATLPMGEALKRNGLTMAAYLEVCARWGPKVDVDATLRKNLAAGLGR